MTTFVDGMPSTTRYQLDNGQTLAAIAGETSTFTLYGRGAIGTFSTEWSYILQDGAGSMRQLAKPDGAVALSVSYTPWGDTLEVYGTGMLDIGYLGGVYDAGTGLIYMGNGQYYDPSSGRFLTRGANADQSNPYTPWNSDPSGMLIAPLALLALVFGRKKNRTKLDHFVILLVIGLSVGLSVSACNTTPEGEKATQTYEAAIGIFNSRNTMTSVAYGVKFATAVWQMNQTETQAAIPATATTIASSTPMPSGTQQKH
jgi:RHS repeat-associated protein